MKQITSSLICSTYNAPKFLELVLDSIKYQDVQNFELIIADDGSTSETSELIDNFRKEVSFPVIHLWHEDLGWRKSQTHNMAIAASSTDHLIFIDGDCILAANFISDHQKVFLENLENYVLMGRRVELGEKTTQQLNLENYREQLFSFRALIKNILPSENRSYLRRFSINSPLMRTILKADKSVKDLLGCNFSLPKSSMIAINGFNDDVQRGEDGDIFVRLRNTGHRLMGKKYFCPMFHLFHGERKYPEVDKNYDELLMKTDYKRCQNGLDKYLA